MASTLKVRRGGAWVAIPDGKLSVRTQGVWKGPQKVWIKRSGAWVDTGFVGNPSTPSIRMDDSVLDYEDYTHVRVSATAPAGGAAITTMRLSLLNSGGGLITAVDQACSTGGTVYWNFNGLSQDTNYIFQAQSISAAGVFSTAVNFHRRTGHPAQGYNQANYGWSASAVSARPAQIDGTSEYEGGGYPGANAVDGNYATMWLSGANADPNAYAALVFQAMGGNRLITSVGAVVQATNAIYQYSYLGLWINGNLAYLLGPTGYGGQYREWYIESYGINLQNLTKFNVSMTNLVAWPLAYRAEISEVYYYYKDWVILSYTWIVTVNYQPNTAW
jgi:hypothetical protein